MSYDTWFILSVLVVMRFVMLRYKLLKFFMMFGSVFLNLVRYVDVFFMGVLLLCKMFEMSMSRVIFVGMGVFLSVSDLVSILIIYSMSEDWKYMSYVII